MAILNIKHLLNLVNASGHIKEGVTLKDLEGNCYMHGSKRFCRVKFRDKKQAKQFINYLVQTYQAEGNSRGKFANVRIKIQ